MRTAADLDVCGGWPVDAYVGTQVSAAGAVAVQVVVVAVAAGILPIILHPILSEGISSNY